MKRTPLKRGKPLARGAGLTRAARGPRQTPPKPTKSPDLDVVTRDAVYRRSGGRCEVGVDPACRMRGRWFEGYAGRSIHHRRPRRMGGTRAIDIHDPANLLAVCGNGTRGCHGYIERNRAHALEQGWLLRSGADPTKRVVTLWNGAVVLLQRDGYELVFPATRGAA